MMESFWSSMQIELLDRKKWKTRVELANAIFEYIEIFHNRQCRHSALGYRTPIEYELLCEQGVDTDSITAASQPSHLESKRWVRSRSHLSVQQTHPNSDELFLVLGGRLTIQLQDGAVVPDPNDVYVVPPGCRALPAGAPAVSSVSLACVRCERGLAERTSRAGARQTRRRLPSSVAYRSAARRGHQQRR